METKLRILVVLPLYGGSLPVGRYCARALSGMGHTVEVFEAPEFYGAFTALKGLRVGAERLEHLESGFVQLVSQAVLAKVESFTPDLVLALAQAPLTRQVLRRLRKDGVPTAMWFVEDFKVFSYWRAFAPYYDFFAVIQKEPFLGELQKIGVENAFYLPLAAEPSFHRPLELDAVEKRKFGAQLSFLGAGYPNRRAAFRRLIRFDLKIWGNDWDGESALARYMQRPGQRIAPEEAVKIFNATAVNLNLHSSVQSADLVPPGDFVNPRTFELAGCGAFQLVDKRELLPELFAPDELATFSTMDELEERIEYFLAHPDERAVYARKGRERVLAAHTYAHRMQTLLDTVAERRPGWPERRPESLDSALPEAFRKELTDVLQRLGLAADTPFEDVVWALRAQQGTLGAMDTAILFLDEWKKQYSPAK